MQFSADVKLSVYIIYTVLLNIDKNSFVFAFALWIKSNITYTIFIII